MHSGSGYIHSTKTSLVFWLDTEVTPFTKIYSCNWIWWQYQWNFFQNEYLIIWNVTVKVGIFKCFLWWHVTLYVQAKIKPLNLTANVRRMAMLLHNIHICFLCSSYFVLPPFNRYWKGLSDVLYKTDFNKVEVLIYCGFSHYQWRITIQDTTLVREKFGKHVNTLIW